jgi:transketolase
MGEKDHSDRQLAGDGGLSFVPLASIEAIRSASADPIERASLLADVCRLNTLYMIMQAGSGHIGSSFSSTDLITWLWTEELSGANSGAPDADVYFSSKGHDAPALYALLIALGKLDFELIHKLRRLGGLPGHPDVETTPFVATNTGSLGMGIAKAYGMARAHRFTGRGGRIVLMTGDGELQEGQIWESLQPCANERLSEIIAVVDHNKLQSDSAVAAVSDLGPIEEKFRHPRRLRAFRDGRRSTEGADRRHHQRQRRVLHGRARLRRPDLSLSCRRAVVDGLPRRRRRIDDAD